MPSETQEEPGPESPHSAHRLHAPLAQPQTRQSEHKWLSANKDKGAQFDKDMDWVLEGTSRGQKLWYRYLEDEEAHHTSSGWGAKEEGQVKGPEAEDANPFRFTKKIHG